MSLTPTYNHRSILKRVFGYDDFRPLQEEVIKNILNKKDALLVMPTGGGKSLCYQVPALLFEGLTIVVSPLISLMKDQVEQLRELNIHAVVLNSSISPGEYRSNIELIKNNRIKLLYISPETLLKTGVLALLSSVKVDCIAIDEAHCISEWGHDFRPEYRQLAEIRQKLPEAACIALTATATGRVREDIINNLKLDMPGIFIGSFNRENLFLQVIPKTEPVDQVIRMLEKFRDQSGIIYCQSRQQVDDLYELLNGKGYPVRPYHAGLDPSERERNQELFIRDDAQIIVATIAFGMGINKPNVRFVVHYDLPKNIETYYQEIGRAGRDGLKSHCLLLFSYGDIQKIKYFIKDKDYKEKHVAGLHLNAILHFAETEECRRKVLLNYFGEQHNAENCGCCDNCLSESKAKTDITIYAQKFLSCVKRTGEIFGAGHIIDTLRGSHAKKIMEFGHQRLSTYGIGLEKTRRQWLQVYRQLMHKGFLVQDFNHGSLKLTGKAWDVLKGKETVLGYLDDNDTEENGLAAQTMNGHDKDLFALLRLKRKQLADSAGIPPYAIFPDKTLIEMATYFPRSQESLLKIHGVGEAKFRKYGQIFLAEIKKYSDDNQKQEIIKTSKSIKGSSGRYGKLRHEEIGEMYNNGSSVPDIMKAFNIKQATVLDHLYRYAREGNALISDSIIHLSKLNPEKISEAMNIFAEHGHEFLTPVFNALKGSIDYEELKLVRLYYLYKNNIVPENKPGFYIAVKEKFAYKQIVCLANSRKYSGRCVAGKEITFDKYSNNTWSPGCWIRPISDEEYGELSIRDIKYADGKLPELLDIIKLPVEKHCPKSFQKENYLIRKSTWISKDKFPATRLGILRDDPEMLWLNGFSSMTGINDRMPADDFNKVDFPSLFFIRPDDLSIIVEEGRNLLKRLRAGFHYKGTYYRFSVTDPAVENQYIVKEPGTYLMEHGDFYICVSISEEFEGFYYKLVAGIIGIDI